MLAVPLARTSPREGRYGRLFVAVVAYFIYSNTLSIFENLVERGKVPVAVGVWPVHAMVAVATVALLLAQNAGSRPAGPGLRVLPILGGRGKCAVRLLDAYIARNVALGALLALAVLTALAAVVTFVDDLDASAPGATVLSKRSSSRS